MHEQHLAEHSERYRSRSSRGVLVSEASHVSIEPFSYIRSLLLRSLLFHTSLRLPSFPYTRHSWANE
jgi:hypothetical protein